MILPMTDSDLVDWADVAAMGVVARDWDTDIEEVYELCSAETLDIVAKTLRHSASEIERLEERVRELHSLLACVRTAMSEGNVLTVCLLVDPYTHD